MNEKMKVCLAIYNSAWKYNSKLNTYEDYLDKN